LFAGIDGNGFLIVRNFNDPQLTQLAKSTRHTGKPEHVIIKVIVKLIPNSGHYQMTLTSIDPVTSKVSDKVVVPALEADFFRGHLGLVSHPGSGEHSGSFWFNHLQTGGSKLVADESRRCGPVIATQYTLSNKVLKLTAQMMPISEQANQQVDLQIEKDGKWQTVASTEIITPGWTAPFRVERWQSERDIPYRVQYSLSGRDSYVTTYSFNGTIRHDPIEKETIVVAAFTGNHNMRSGVERSFFDWTEDGVWFPHNDIVRNVLKHR
jgi:hypothetical protein